MIQLSKVADLSDTERTAVRALSQAVYPPDEVKDWPGRHVEWAKPDSCVRIHGADGELTCFVGLIVREGTLDGRAVTIGGIGGVMTHPLHRNQGLAGKGIRRAIAAFRDKGNITFGLLACDARLLEYYSKLGWREFTGKTMVRQRSEQVAFTFNRVMTIGVLEATPHSGMIDLCGPPW